MKMFHLENPKVIIWTLYDLEFFRMFARLIFFQIYSYDAFNYVDEFL
jgi:hypothetical protein